MLSKCVVLCWMLAPVLEYYSGPTCHCGHRICQFFTNSLYYTICCPLCCDLMTLVNNHTHTHVCRWMVSTVVQLEKWQPVMQAWWVTIFLIIMSIVYFDVIKFPLRYTQISLPVVYVDYTLLLHVLVFIRELQVGLTCTAYVAAFMDDWQVVYACVI